MLLRITQFSEGIKTDPLNRCLKAIKCSVRERCKLVENILDPIFHVLLSLFPTRALAILKNSLNPTFRLNYRPLEILLFADSNLSFPRSRACIKEPETVHWIESFFPQQIGLTDEPGFLPFCFKSFEAGSADHWFGNKLSAPTSTRVKGSRFVQGYTIDNSVLVCLAMHFILSCCV